MKIHNSKRGLTRDFVSLILSDMKTLERQEDFIRNSVDYSGSEHQNAHNKIAHLLAVKEAMHALNLIINDYCIEQIEALRRASQKKALEVDFLDMIDPRAVIQKREAALLCGRSESWLQKGNHKDQFDNEKNGGLNVLSFASYLKEFKPFEYETFVKNYKKETQLKVG
ncbi:MAG: hypothetical protein R8N23_10435 [Reichenbachiella sp.]|uniref:hypothetical protein n=1 Tax=Reichenbachiella sp. TaxID=2184521 RepID=UPI0029673530|nr:hypothetical protein [Reichenbachiella sp.]MDW3210275.1 hypothetical protein [Reichenbachiella sp.]